MSDIIGSPSIPVHLTGSAGVGSRSVIGGASLPVHITGSDVDFTPEAEELRDLVATFLVAGTNITVTHDDPGNTLTIASSGGGLDAETVRDTIATALTAGNNIDITVDDPGDTITIAVEALTSADISDLAEFIRDTIAAALVAGTNVTITPNDGSDTITIDASGGGVDAETVRDTIGTALVAGNNIDITVNDGSDTITIDVETLTSGDISDFTEAVQDVVGAAVAAGNNIDVTYDDGTGLTTIAVESLTSADLTDFNSASDTRADLRIANALAGATEITGGRGIDFTSGGVIDLDHPLSTDPTAVTSLLAMTADPVYISGSTSHTDGTLYLIKFYIPAAVTLTNVLIAVTNAITNNLTLLRFGLYSAAGALVASTPSDVTTTWNSIGNKTKAFSSPYAAAAGVYYFAYLMVGTTAPTFGKLGINNTHPNMGTTSAGWRCGSLASQSDLPANLTGGTALTAFTNSGNYAVAGFT